MIIGVLLGFSSAVSAAVTYCAPSAYGYGASATGGGSTTPVLVGSVSELQAALNKGKNKVIIITKSLTFTKMLSVQDGANVTLLGLPGVTLTSLEQTSSTSGILYVKRFNNLIIRNLTFVGPGAYDCDGNDLLCFESVTNAWVDHCDFQDGCDGNFDNKKLSDNVTISWCRFRYLKKPKAGGSGGSDDHRFTNLLGSSSSDKPSDGTFNYTWAYCWWDEGCKERMVRCRNCELHFLNCYWNSSVANYYVGPENAKCYFEGCTFEGKANSSSKIFKSYGGTNACKFVDCSGNLPSNSGSVSTPSYAYTASGRAEAKTAVTNATCGAGATLTVTTAGAVSSTCDGSTPPPTVYTVTWNATANGGSCGTATTQVTDGNAIGSLPEASKSGYTFDGWFTAPSGGTKISSSTTVTGNITYYAQFTEIITPPTPVYTIIWDANGGTCATASTSVESGQTIGSVIDPLPTATKSENTFDGWFTAISGGTQITTSTTITGNITYYAHYTATGGGGGGGCETLAQGTKNATTKATIDASTGTIGNTGTSADNGSVKLTGGSSYFTITAKAGYTPITVGDKLTVTLYNKDSSPKTLGFRVHANDATTHTTSVAATSTADVVYTLTAGDIETDGTIKIYRSGSGDHYEAILLERCDGSTPANFVLSYDENGGTGTMPDQEQTGANVTVVANGFTAPAGYAFLKWNTEMNGGGTDHAASDVISLTEDLTLYAIWAPQTYTVTLNAESGTGGTPSVTATFDEAMPSIAVPTRDGYVFHGYFTGADGAGTQYYDENGSSTNSWNIAANTELHAYWGAGSAPVTTGCDLHFWFVKEADAPSGITNDDTFFSGMVGSSSTLAGSLTIDGNSYSVTGRTGDPGTGVFGSFTISAGKTGTFYALAVSSGGAEREIDLVGSTETYTLTVSGGSDSYKRIESEELPAGTYSINRGSKGNVRLGIVVVKTCATEPSWELEGEFDSWAGTAMTETAGVASVMMSLAANTRYEFKFKHGSDQYGNTGAIVTDISGWPFATDRDNCILYTGPAGDYTFTINTSTNEASVTYPVVSHPCANYVYFVKPGDWNAVRIYNYTSDVSRMSDWNGSPTITNTATICEQEYYYCAAYPSFDNVKWRDNNSPTPHESTGLSTSVGLGKYFNFAESTTEWRPFATYTISFNAGGGTGSMASLTEICPNSDQALTANSFTRTGYTFANWTANVATKVSGSTVAAGSAIANSATLQEINSDIILTAQWTANSYAITLAKGDHGVANQEATVVYDATALTAITPVVGNTGYSLIGYYDGDTKVLNNDGSFAASDVVSYITDSKWSKAADCTLTAKWEAKTTTIIINANTANHGSTAPAAITATFASVLPAFTAATGESGYDLTGYWTAATDGTKIIEVDGTLVRNTAYSTDEATPKWNSDVASLELFAQYEVGLECTPHDINAAATTDLGSGNTPRYVVEVAGVGRLMKNKTGSSAWSLSSGALQTGSNMFALQAYNDISEIVIYGNGTGGNRTLSKVEVGTATNNYAEISASATVKGTDDGKFTTSGVADSMHIAIDVAANSYVAITFSGNINIAKVSLVTCKVPCSIPDAPDGLTVSSITFEGATFIITDDETPFGWEIYYSTSSTVPIASTAATLVTTEKINDITGLTPSSTYYAWVRSVCDDTHKSAWVALTGNSFATAAPPVYTVTLHTNGGTINSGNITSYTYGVGATLPTDLTKDGSYTFAGWYDNSSLTGVAVTEISTTDAGNKEYWAAWEYTGATFQYILGSCYVKDGVWTQGADGSVGAWRYKSEDGNLVLTTDIDFSATAAGVYFNTKDLTKLDDAGSWGTSSSSDRAIKALKVEAGSTETFDLETLTACRITFYVFPGSNDAYSLDLTVNGSTENKEIPTSQKDKWHKYAYNGSFTGEFSIKSNDKESRVVVIVEVPAVRISFDNNGGSGSMTSMVVSTGEEVQLEENTFYRTDYRFIGWTEDAGGIGVLIADKAMYSTDEDVTLYAQWEEIIRTNITFVATGAYNKYTTSAIAEYGAAMPEILTLPLHSSMVFDGYYSEPDGAGTQYYNGLGYGVRNWDKTVDATLYAKWLTPCDLRPTLTNVTPIVTIWDGVKVDEGVVRLNCEYDTTGISYSLQSFSLSEPLTGCTFEYFDEAIHLMGVPTIGNTETKTITVTFTMKNSCSPASTYTISQTIRIYPFGTKPKVAFILTGTEGGAWNAYTADDRTACSDLLTYLGTYYDITCVNGYATKDEAAIAAYYAQYDLLVVTDFLNTKEGYTNAIGSMIDKKPILSFEAYVANLSNWHIGSNPKDPKPKVKDMKVLCAGHAIFKNAKYNPGDAEETVVVRSDTTVNVLTSLSSASKAKGLQGFTINEAPDFIFLATVRDANNNRDLIVCCERQMVFPARLLLYGINFYEMGNLSNAGKIIMRQMMDYLLMTDETKIADCSLVFDNGMNTDGTTEPGGGDHLWSNPKNWSPGRNIIPTPFHPTRIIAECHVDIDNAHAGSVKINKGRDEHNNLVDGKLIVQPYGGLTVAGLVAKVNNTRYASPITIKAEDLLIKADATHNGAFVYGNKESDVRATVEYYSRATGSNTANPIWQYMGIPFQPSKTAINMYYKAWMCRWAEGSTDDLGGLWQWVDNNDVLIPFEGYCITQEAAKKYTNAGKLNPPTTKTIILDNRDGDGYAFAANSWTAPIKIQEMQDADFNEVEKAIYIYHTGSYAEWGTNGTPVNATTGVATLPGQYAVIPIHSSPYIAGADSVIPAMQGFFVKTTSVDATLKLVYNRVVYDATYFKTSTQPMRAPKQKNAAPDVMRLVVIGEASGGDQVHLLSHSDFSNSYEDGWDGRKLDGDEVAPKLAVVKQEGEMAVAAIPEFEGRYLSFRAGEDVNYTFHFNYEGEEMYLYDVETQQATLIKTGNTYAFNAANKTPQNRFLITANPPRIPTDIESVESESLEPRGAQKFIRNDKLFILHKGVIYDALGERVERRKEGAQ